MVRSHSQVGAGQGQAEMHGATIAISPRRDCDKGVRVVLKLVEAAAEDVAPASTFFLLPCSLPTGLLELN